MVASCERDVRVRRDDENDLKLEDDTMYTHRDTLIVRRERECWFVCVCVCAIDW